MSNLHPTSILSESANIDSSVIVGPYCIIGDNVSIGESTILHSHIVVTKNTKIGRNNEIFPFVSLGQDCQDLKYNGEESWLEIGDHNSIRESCSFHRGTIQDNGLTKIGSHNLFMVNTHVAHDCVIGDHNVVANNVGIAGHCVIGSNIIIGGNSGIHQFCKIDDYSLVGGQSLIVKDVAAMVMVSGNPAKAHGLNLEGMRRKSWSKESINVLREAYKVIFRSGLTTQQAISKIEMDLLPTEPKVKLMINSLNESKRGVTR